MGYCDLNIPSNGKVTLAELNQWYKCIAVNVVTDGTSPPPEVSQIPDIGLTQKPQNKSKKSNGYSPNIHAGLQLVNTLEAEGPRQVKRLTITTNSMNIIQTINSSNLVRSYDIIAAQTTSNEVFQYLCETADVDIITFDFMNRMPFQIKKSLVDTAIKRSIYFEITYTSCLGESTGRRYFFSNAATLIRLTKGRNIILTSGASRDLYLRAPYDVLNLGIVCGLTYNQAQQAISTSWKIILDESKRRHGVYGISLP